MSFICANCVGETYLRRIVQDAATTDNICEYCDDGAEAADLWTIVYKCDEVLDTYFEESSGTMAVVHFGRTPAGADLSTTITQIAGLSRNAAELVAERLLDVWRDESTGEDRYGDDDPWFVLRSSISDQLGYAWKEMADSLRHHSRFFNPKAAALLHTVFGDLDNDRDHLGMPVVVTVGPNTPLQRLYRGRVFQTEPALVTALRWPERLLGAPAPGIGLAGRMNSSGQPAFYGATTPQVCIAEVRPPVGSTVALAAFEIARPLRLLDLRRLENVQVRFEASLFDPSTRPAVQRRDFLRTLGRRISAPVLPELQDKDYLVTQAVADYLASHPSTSVDGILYPSSQSTRPGEEPEGYNVVLFRKACNVADANAESETAEVMLWEYEDDGPGQWLSPTIQFKELKDFEMKDTSDHPALRLVRDSIVIHEVTAVRYQSKETEVSHVASTNNFHRR